MIAITTVRSAPTSDPPPHQIPIHIRSASASDPHPHQIHTHISSSSHQLRTCIRSASPSDPHRIRSASTSDPYPHQIRIRIRYASASDLHPHQICTHIRSTPASDPHTHQIRIRIRYAYGLDFRVTVKTSTRDDTIGLDANRWDLYLGRLAVPSNAEDPSQMSITQCMGGDCTRTNHIDSVSAAHVDSCSFTEFWRQYHFVSNGRNGGRKLQRRRDPTVVIIRPSMPPAWGKRGHPKRAAYCMVSCPKPKPWPLSCTCPYAPSDSLPVCCHDADAAQGAQIIQLRCALRRIRPRSSRGRL